MTCCCLCLTLSDCSLASLSSTHLLQSGLPLIGSLSSQSVALGSTHLLQPGLSLAASYLSSRFLIPCCLARVSHQQSRQKVDLSFAAAGPPSYQHFRPPLCVFVVAGTLLFYQ